MKKETFFNGLTLLLFFAIGLFIGVIITPQYPDIQKPDKLNLQEKQVKQMNTCIDAGFDTYQSLNGNWYCKAVTPVR